MASWRRSVSRTRGTLHDSWIVGNEVHDNGLDGIFIEGATIISNISLYDNEAEGNHAFDCHDDSTGVGRWGRETFGSTTPAI